MFKYSLLLLALLVAAPTLAHYQDEGKEIPNVGYVLGSEEFLDFKVFEFSPKASPNTSCVYIENTYGIALSCYSMEVESD